MDRIDSVTPRDFQALAQPLISHAEGLEKSLQDALHPQQVLNLLGLLGDIAEASLPKKPLAQEKPTQDPILQDEKIIRALLDLRKSKAPPQ